METPAYICWKCNIINKLSEFFEEASQHLRKQAGIDLIREDLSREFNRFFSYDAKIIFNHHPGCRQACRGFCCDGKPLYE